ncbi:MAG: hypothetical protein ACE5NC_01960, partial [Anaerolineae bacterium]
ALAPAIALGLPVGPVSMVMGGIFSLGTLWLVYRYLGTTPAGAWAGVIAAGFLAADGSFALWAVGGLETALFALLVTAGSVSYLREDGRPQRGLATGLLFALATMTRPEGLLVLGVTAVHSAARALAGRRLPGQTDLLRLLGFAALYAPYFLWRFSYYGYPFPNTYYLKIETSDRAAQIARGWAHLGTFLGGHGGWFLPGAAALAFLGQRLRKATSYLALVVGLFVAYVTYVGGDWSVGRFFVPILPLFYGLVAFGLIGAYGRLGRLWKEGPPRPIQGMAAASIVAIAGLLFIGSSLGGESRLFVKGLEARRATEARVAMGRWLREHVPQETHLAVDAAGQIPYFSRLRILDLFGPTDPHIARLAASEEAAALAGHTKFDFDYFLEQSPDLVVVYDPEGGFLNPDVGYERAPWVWTDDPDLAGFLTLYRRTGWTPGMAILGEDGR